MKVFNWLINKWLAGFITASIFFLLKYYIDLPIAAKQNFLNFEWLKQILEIQLTLWKVGIVILFLVIMLLIDRRRKVKIKAENYGVKIESIVEGANVKHVDYIKGTFKYLPNDLNIVCFVGGKDLKSYWPQKVHCDRDNKNFTATVNFGNPSQVGAEFYFVLAIATDSICRWIDYYYQSGNTTKQYLPFKDPFNDDLVKCGKPIKVIRI